MPQPLRKIYRSMTTGAEALRYRERLAIHIAVIAQQWSKIESDMSTFFVLLADGDAELVTDIYLALRAESAQRAAMLAVGSRKLGQAQQEQLEKLFTKVRKESLPRNRVVHGMWSVVSDHPHELIWSDPRDHAVWNAQLQAAIHRNDKRAIAKLENESPKRLLYSEQDFIEIENRQREFEQEVFATWIDKILWPPPLGP